jgi:hypothetical protein
MSYSLLLSTLSVVLAVVKRLVIKSQAIGSEVYHVTGLSRSGAGSSGNEK